MRQQIQAKTAGEIAAAETEEDVETSTADSTEASPDASEADPAPDTSLPSGAGTGEPDTRVKRSSLGLIALILGAVLAVVGSWWWWQAAHDDQLAAAQERDTVLIAATEGIETLNTLDYRDVDESLAAWEDVTTGVTKDGIAGTDESARQLLVDAKKITNGEVLDAAVLSIDGNDATVVASVVINVVDDAAPGSAPTEKRNRFAAELKRDSNGEWKIEDLKQVAVSLS